MHPRFVKRGRTAIRDNYTLQAIPANRAMYLLPPLAQQTVKGAYHPVRPSRPFLGVAEGKLSKVRGNDQSV